MNYMGLDKKKKKQKQKKNNNKKKTNNKKTNKPKKKQTMFGRGPISISDSTPPPPPPPPPNNCNETAINANFHFSHYKSMETWSCHSNQSTYATEIKKKKGIISQRLRLWIFLQSFNFIPLMASEKMIIFLDIFVCANLAFRLPWQPIRFSSLDKNYMFGRGLLNKHLWKTFAEISATR